MKIKILKCVNLRLKCDNILSFFFFFLFVFNYYFSFFLFKVVVLYVSVKCLSIIVSLGVASHSFFTHENGRRARIEEL